MSIAATLATIRKMQREPVHARLDELGERVLGITRANIDKHGLGAAMAVAGRPSWGLMQFRDADGASAAEIKSLFLQEIIARGILTAGSYNICYAHTDEDLRALDRAQDESCRIVREALAAGDIAQRLAGPAIQPVFRVR